MAFTIEYFNEKVLAEIENWSPDLYANYLRLSALLMQHGPDLRLPYSRSLGGGLFELRVKGKNTIARVLYCFLIGNKIVVVHAFIKKTQQTPHQDLLLSKKRILEIKHG